MIRWGIVFHGFADGYCRTVCVPPNFRNLFTKHGRLLVSEPATIIAQTLFWVCFLRQPSSTASRPDFEVIEVERI
jgi:hypothetical protein